MEIRFLHDVMMSSNRREENGLPARKNEVGFFQFRMGSAGSNTEIKANLMISCLALYTFADRFSMKEEQNKGVPLKDHTCPLVPS